VTQSGAYLALYLLGVAFQLGFGPRRQTALCCALGFLTGLALWVVAAAVVLASPFAYGERTAIAAYVVPLVVCVVAAGRRWRPGRRELVIVAAWTAASAVLFVWLCSFDSSRFSADSRHIVSSALELPEDGSLRYLAGKGGFHILAHSIAQFTSADYNYALSAVTGLALAPLFVVVGWRGLERLGAADVRARVLVVIAAAATVGTYNYLWHLVYIHNNLGSAVYLFAFAATFWLAELEEDTAYLPAAFLFLAGYTLHRVEAPAFAVILVLITVFPSKLPRRALTIGLAAFTISCALWYGVVLVENAPRLTDARKDQLAQVMIALLAAWLVVSRTRLRSLARHLPRALAAVFALLLVYGYFERNYEVERSADAFYQNLIVQRHHMWGYAWPAVLALWALSLTAPAPPAGHVLSYGALLAFLGVAAFALEHPYRVGPTDSGNRMMIQVLPVAMLYFSMQFLPLFRDTRARDENPERSR